MSCVSINILLQVKVADELQLWEKNQIQIKYLMAWANAVEVDTLITWKKKNNQSTENLIQQQPGLKVSSL